MERLVGGLACNPVAATTKKRRCQPSLADTSSNSRFRVAKSLQALADWWRTGSDPALGAFRQTSARLQRA